MICREMILMKKACKKKVKYKKLLMPVATYCNNEEKGQSMKYEAVNLMRLFV